MLLCTDAIDQMLMHISSSAYNKPQARHYTLTLCIGELSQKVIQRAQGHTASKKQSQDSNPEQTTHLFISMMCSLSPENLSWQELSLVPSKKKKKKKGTQIFVGKKLKTSLGKIGYNLILVPKVSYFSALQTFSH